MIPKFGNILVGNAGQAYYGQPATLAFQLNNDNTPDQTDFADVTKALRASSDNLYFNLEVEQVGDPPLSGKYKSVHSVTQGGGREITDISILQRLSDLVKKAPLSDYTKERALDHIAKTIEKQQAGLDQTV